MRQWGVKLGFELVKMRHAITARRGDDAQRQNMKEELEAYIRWAY